jgi:hypothetical protein
MKWRRHVVDTNQVLMHRAVIEKDLCGIKGGMPEMKDAPIASQRLDVRP